MKNNEEKKVASGRKRGIVISDSMDKTVVVRVLEFKTHPKYDKKMRVTKNYKAHDFENRAKIGDRVEIEPCRPISGGKKYKLVMN